MHAGNRFYRTADQTFICRFTSGAVSTCRGVLHTPIIAHHGSPPYDLRTPLVHCYATAVRRALLPGLAIMPVVRRLDPL